MTEVAPTRAVRAGRPSARLDGVESSFAAAAAATGGITEDRYAMAGATICLRFASPALRERLTPAFAHLAEPSSNSGSAPALMVSLWDSASTGAEPPPRPSAPDDHAPGALFHYHEPPLRSAYQPGLETLSILDSESSEAWHWVADAFDQPYWDQASPIRQILFWWLSSRGYLQVHGAAVGTRTGGVLLVGKGGSGKSTVALSSLGSELLYAGDDYVAVTLEPTPRVQSLYSSAKLEPHHIREFLPALVPLIANGERLDDEKAVLYLHEHFPDHTTAGFPLRAVVVPQVTPTRREPRIVEASRAAALAALAPSTIFQLHTADQSAFSEMSRLIGQLPCYALELGSDAQAIPGAIAALLSTLPSD
jgi:hypothetical protein